MNTLALHPTQVSETPSPFAGLAAWRARLTPMAVILVGHALLFYAVYSGMLHRVVQVIVPQEVMVSFVVPKTPVKIAATPPVQEPSALPPPSVVVPQLDVQVAVQNERPLAVTRPAVAALPLAPAPIAVAAPPSSGPRTITSVEYIQPPQLHYPPASRRLGEQGKVILRVLVNEKGLPEQITVETSSGSSRLDEAGRRDAQSTLFKPHMEDGRAVPVFVLMPLNYTLT